MLAAAKAGNSEVGKNEAADTGGKYWVSNTNNKRHNSSCRCYRNSKDKLGNKDEGVSRNICSGRAICEGPFLSGKIPVGDGTNLG